MCLFIAGQYTGKQKMVKNILELRDRRKPYLNPIMTVWVKSKDNILIQEEHRVLLEGPIDSVVADLKRYAEELIDTSIITKHDPYDNYDYNAVVGWREMTEQERKQYEKFMEQEEKFQENQKKKEEEQERKQYEKLKRKFEK